MWRVYLTRFVVTRRFCRVVFRLCSVGTRVSVVLSCRLLRLCWVTRVLFVGLLLCRRVTRVKRLVLV